ncbi:MAG: Ser-Thr-rich GPI-anchored membrane family protein [Methanomassiliicoccus sp.]|nr:Ser-Thr-rich GPI-anchored membrane family protein [Methanomassiliicoccus sp.]
MSAYSITIAVMLLACSFFVMFTSNADADSGPAPSEVTIFDQDYSQNAAIPQNIVLGNNLQYSTDATLSYNTGEGAVEYKTASGQVGSMYVGIEPFVNGNITIDLKVTSDHWKSSTYITGSTFVIQTLSLPEGGARVISYYATSASDYAYQYYDVPASALSDGINTIHIMAVGTTKSLTIFYNDEYKITTPMSSWSIQALPYDPLTLPMLRFDNELGSYATWASVLLYGVKETVSGGVVTAVPGNDYLSFGIDAPKVQINAQGTSYMYAQGDVGVAWVDVVWLQQYPEQITYAKDLLAKGWELGIHFSKALNTLSAKDAQALMLSEYNQITQIFGQAPTTWCSLYNSDTVDNAVYAYNSLHMLWRTGSSGTGYLANIGNLDDERWSEFWSKVSDAQMVYPCFTHNTDQTVADDYSISYSNFVNWVDNYEGKHIIGFNEYYYRIANQVDTKIHYQTYSPDQDVKFSVECNGFPSRLTISFSTASSALVLKNGNLLAKGTDYTVAGNQIVLFARSNDVIEVKTQGATPGAPQNIGAVGGDSKVTLTWSAPSSNGGSTITGYKIYRGSSSGSETLLTTVGNVLTYTDTAVTNGVTYYYKVSAVNAVNEGPQSSESSAAPTAAITAPSAPQNVVATAGNGQVVLTWKAPASNGGSDITGYKIYRGSSSGSETLLTTLGNVATYTDASLTNGVTYYYKVSAVNSAKEGALSGEVSAKPVAVPSAPTLASATAGDAKVTLTWSAPSSNGGSTITGYAIYRGTSTNGETLLTTVGNVLTYADSAVTNGVTYYYKVAAVNSIGTGVQSNEKSATPVRAITVTAPATDATWYRGSSYTITWTASGSADVRIDLMQGSTVVDTIAATTADDGSYSWTVPATEVLGSGYQIRVSTASDQSQFALSPGKVQIATSAVTVTAPASASTSIAGSTVKVTWTTAGKVSNLKVDLLKGGVVVQTLSASTPNDGSQSFTLPYTLSAGSDYSIKLTDTTNAGVSGTSGLFTIRAPAMTITSPNGGQTLVQGASVSVQWTGDLSVLSKVSITLWKDGVKVATLVSSTTNTGSYTWTVSTSLAAGSGYSIRVASVDYPQYYDQSDSTFTLRKAVLTVTSPTDGSSYGRLSSVAIKWTKESANIGQIKIELYRSGALNKVITSSTTNDGAYTWIVPLLQASGSYQIKITSTSDSTIYAWSGTFTVR